MATSGTFSEEVRLLLDASRAVVSSDDHCESALPIDTSSIDWEYTHRLARRHGLLSQLYGYLDDVESDVPSDTRSALSDEALEIQHRNLRYAGEMDRLLNSFDESGVRALPFKGPVVAILGYGDLGLRSFGDLDFLVPPADIPAAAAVLEEKGYTVDTDLGPYTLQYVADDPHGHIFPFPGEIEFVHEERELYVEIRFARGGLYGGGRLGLEELWDDRTTESIVGRDCPVLSSTDRLVLLTSHGSKHMWYRLEWLAGLVAVARRTNGDWHDARDRARDRGTLSELYLGVLLAIELFDATIPEDLEGEARRYDRAAAATTEIIDRYAREPMVIPSEAQLRHSRGELRGDLPVRYLRFGTRPTIEDYRSVSLPEPLWPLYRFVRIVRGVKRSLRS